MSKGAMAYVLADNIISPLGDTSEGNYFAVKCGKSGIQSFVKGSHDIPDGFVASLLSRDFESLVLESVQKTLETSQLDVAHSKVVFILSSTKGLVERLGKNSDEHIYLGQVAESIAKKIGIFTKPIVVCNACISGLSALILASRLLTAGKYDYAVVCGCDCPDRFIISGFQSLKALSSEPCRPFDMERLGLNLGEAAATILLSREVPLRLTGNIWQISHGFIRNDAFHISAPSKTSDGLYKALKETCSGVDKDKLAFVNAHGTATLFNDQMESIAIQRAGLSDIPINALKGYFGHTLGAAGVLETILSMKAVDDHTIIGTRGYEEAGVSGKIDISADNRSTDKLSFIKMLSGFGGCNATIFVSKDNSILSAKECSVPFALKKTHQVKISANEVVVDGQQLFLRNKNMSSSLLTGLYKQEIDDYPKFYKMDGLCRLGFVASELLLQIEGKKRFQACDDRAIVFFNRSSSISSDKKYLESIQDKDNYYPSPSVFVYTLPNIVTGEIAIRNHYHGETSFFILSSKDKEQMENVVKTVFQDRHIKSVLTGWVDYEDEEHFEADLALVESN